ncbi:MAG: hypothetical protein AAGB48_03750 [Planctomycetota bacterium]
MELSQAIETLARSDSLVYVIAGVIAIVAIVFTTTGKVLRVHAGERTKREIAAYIAEGSMTPEQGERLLKAGKKYS